ncbi:hypothetical protein NP233_g5895 [Leucocoprinus birnbaumii]|uniref:Uncharacterized protein n=1 Tax=Leucocoprinus birnbaumii TaxID=56174 RepID=A0AAD5VUB3_9AGAR|nr:hypothetical protein NP233_g5895 [Leucocoprinus birnbaumii]
MSDQKFDQKSDFSSPPNYPGPPAGSGGPSHPQAAYMNNMPQQQSPYMGQQPMPGVQTQYQQTTTTTARAGHPQMAPMQPQMTGQPMMGQPQVMNMGTTMSMGSNGQPQGNAVMMNVMMPGTVGGTNYMDLCAQGMHARTRKYGACGIITAILCFPIGLIALLGSSGIVLTSRNIVPDAVHDSDNP